MHSMLLLGHLRKIQTRKLTSNFTCYYLFRKKLLVAQVIFNGSILIMLINIATEIFLDSHVD